MLSLFWSFANSNFSLKSAKAPYGVMVAFAQLGSILGPTVVAQYAATVGVANIYLIGALCMLLLQCTSYLWCSRTECGGCTKVETKGECFGRVVVVLGPQLHQEHLCNQLFIHGESYNCRLHDEGTGKRLLCNLAPV
jgi:hypothetical protein